ncbi:MAG: TIGR00266 family protein [Thermoplasmata archaeon]|nr:TIGR00266 family protein [Thermoplasmata archaeon]
MLDEEGRTKDNYNFSKEGTPAFTALKLQLSQGQSVTAEKGAMMTMSRTLTIETKKRASGILKSLKVAALGGESFFVNTYTAQGGPGELTLVAPGIGDIVGVTLEGGELIIQKTSYLASAPGVNIDTNWQGLKGLMAEGGLFMLYANGYGTIWLASFGAIVQRTLAPGEMLSVDNGHLVAWPAHMQYTIRRVGGIKSTLLSGEGLVADFVGPGTLLLQTRHWPAFASALAPFLPQQR